MCKFNTNTLDELQRLLSFESDHSHSYCNEITGAGENRGFCDYLIAIPIKKVCTASVIAYHTRLFWMFVCWGHTEKMKASLKVC